MYRRLLLLLACWTSAAAAPPYERPAGYAEFREPMIVAGYRALFTCSAHFFAGRPLEDILEVELVDTQEFSFPPPVIDRRRQLVSAGDGRGGVMTAAFRDSMGCTLLPPQWSIADAARLPYVAYPPAPDQRDRPFPAGDLVSLVCTPKPGR